MNSLKYPYTEEIYQSDCVKVSIIVMEDVLRQLKKEGDNATMDIGHVTDAVNQLVAANDSVFPRPLKLLIGGEEITVSIGSGNKAVDDIDTMGFLREKAA